MICLGRVGEGVETSDRFDLISERHIGEGVGERMMY